MTFTTQQSHLEFYLSADMEKQKLMDIFCCEPVGKDLKYRTKQYNFPFELAERMYNLPRFQWDAELEALLEQRYQQNNSELEKSLSFFNHFWKENGERYLAPLNAFFKETVPTYRVLLACYLDVISNWKECNIVINHALYKKENVLYSVYSILFEIILSQVFIKIRAIKNKNELPDMQVWEYAELAACAILNKIYPEFKNSTKTGYAELDIHAPRFIDLAQKSPDLNAFLQDIIRFKI